MKKQRWDLSESGMKAGIGVNCQSLLPAASNSEIKECLWSQSTRDVVAVIHTSLCISYKFECV